MFHLTRPKSNAARKAFLDLTQLSNLVVRWLPFGAHRSVGTSLQHLGSLPLTAQSSVALVRVYDETLVLGITSQTVTLLTKTAGHSSESALAAAEKDDTF